MNFDSKKLRKLRMEKRLTQTDLATDVKTRQGTISKLEKGDGDPSFVLVARIAQVFNVSVDYFIAT